MKAHPTRVALLCPGLYHYLKGERREGSIFFALAAICLTTIAFYARAEADPFGHHAVRLAIAVNLEMKCGLPRWTANQWYGVVSEESQRLAPPLPPPATPSIASDAG